MPLLTLKQVTKSFREPGSAQSVPVLRGVDLEVEPGESVAIVGPSGCGKSTLLNLIGTLDLPDSGEYFFEGKKVSDLGSGELARLRSQKMGFIFQLHHLLPQCTALENVLIPTLALPAELREVDAEARAKELLAAVGLQDRFQWKPNQLSGGERQRVAVVRALMNRPSLVLADEPTGALDESNAEKLTDLLVDLQKSFGVSLVLVTHHQSQAQRMSRVLKMQNGCMVQA